MEPFIGSRGFKRRRTVTPKDGTVAVTAKQASLALSKKVNKLAKLVKGIQPELKFFTSSGVFANVSDTAGAAALLLPIAAGVNQSDRISDRIRVKRVQLQVRLSTGAGSIGTAPTAEEFTRFYLVQDTQQQSDTVVVPTDVLQTVSAPVFPILNVSNAQARYKMLWYSPLLSHARCASVSTGTVGSVPMSPTQSPVCHVDRKMDLIVTYNDVNSTDIQKNGIYLVVSTNYAADTLDCDYNYRISYLDD